MIFESKPLLEGMKNECDFWTCIKVDSDMDNDFWSNNLMERDIQRFANEKKKKMNIIHTGLSQPRE